MSLKLGDVFPDFAADAYPQQIQSFHKFIGDSWTILFSHPADYTPVCTTELARVVQLSDDFTSRGVKLVALSCDSVKSHAGWSNDILHVAKNGLNSATTVSEGSGFLPFPIIADESRDLANQLGMIDLDETAAAGIPLTARAVFVIGPDKRLKLSLLYPASIGRNFDEILRIVDALQLAARVPVATPVDWRMGGACMVVPTLSEDEANRHFGGKVKSITVPSGKPYLRTTPQPL